MKICDGLLGDLWMRILDVWFGGVIGLIHRGMRVGMEGARLARSIFGD